MGSRSLISAPVYRVPKQARLLSTTVDIFWSAHVLLAYGQTARMQNTPWPDGTVPSACERAYDVPQYYAA